jgi:hypothetical protein
VQVQTRMACAIFRILGEFANYLPLIKDELDALCTIEIRLM